jgi:hypothetical protein
VNSSRRLPSVYPGAGESSRQRTVVYRVECLAWEVSDGTGDARQQVKPKYKL